MAVVLHHSRAKGTAKLVLLGIANHQGDGGAWPSVETLARYANVDGRAVQKCLTKLVSSGELRREVQAGGLADMDDHARPNRYEVLVKCPPWCDHTPQHRDTRKLSGRQGSLWKNPLSARTPGVHTDTPPLSTGTPAPLSARTPEPHPEPGANKVGALTTDRARVQPPANWRPCDECSQPQRECERRQTKLAPEDQHQYRPRQLTP